GPETVSPHNVVGCVDRAITVIVTRLTDGGGMNVNFPNQGRLERGANLVIDPGEVVDAIEWVAIQATVIGIDRIKRELDVGDPAQEQSALVVEDADKRRRLRRIKRSLRVVLVVDHPRRIGLKVTEEVEIVPSIGRVHDGSR